MKCSLNTNVKTMNIKMSKGNEQAIWGKKCQKTNKCLGRCYAVLAIE